MDGVGSDEVGSEVVGCCDLDFSVGTFIFMVGGVEEVVTMVEIVGGGEASFLEPETKELRISKMEILPEGVEEEVRGTCFFLVAEDSPRLRIFFF